MTERQRLQKLTKYIKENHPDVFWYKIPDTFGGHKKPFDVFAVVNGKAFGLEFKAPGGKLAEHQAAALAKMTNSGGFGWCVEFDENFRDENFIHTLEEYAG